MAFDPDAYLAQKENPSSGSFDPDAYLASKNVPVKDSSQEAFRKQYLEENQPNMQGALNRLKAEGSKAAGIVGGLGSMVKNAAGEAYDLGSNYLRHPIDTNGSILKTAAEAGERIVGDPVSMIASKLSEYKDNPKTALSDYLKALVPNPVMQAMIPKGTSEGDIESAYKQKLLSEELAKQREKGYISNIPGVNQLPGDVKSNLADAALLVAPGFSKEGRAMIGSTLDAGKSIPLMQGAGTALKGVGNVVEGTAKSIGKAFIPTTVEDDFVNALNPGTNPVNVAKAKQAVKTVIPNAQDVIQRSGANLDTASGAVKVSDFGKRDVWKNVEEKTGLPIVADATPIADAYLQIANDPVIQKVFPESVVEQLKKEASKYSGVEMPVQDLENIKQTFNAINQTKENLSRSKKAALVRSDPMYAAIDKANEAIGGILEDKFGPEFTDQKRQYGAWKQINDLATKQAIRQEILDGKVSAFEGLGILGAVAQGMADEGSFFKGASTAIAGKALKYVNSPDAKFSNAARKISSLPKSEVAGKLSSRVNQQNLEDLIKKNQKPPYNPQTPTGD